MPKLSLFTQFGTNDLLIEMETFDTSSTKTTNLNS